jgi:hypothetical protein
MLDTFYLSQMQNILPFTQMVLKLVVFDIFSPFVTFPAKTSFQGQHCPNCFANSGSVTQAQSNPVTVTSKTGVGTVKIW